jgi:ketosteroid isomerase-like protein
MKVLMKIALLAIAALGAAACTETTKPAANGNTVANTNTNTNANSAAAKPPATKEALVALEKKAFDAWKTHDGKFFEGFLTSNFVMYGQNGKILDKAAMVKEISESKCDTKDVQFTTSDEHLTPVGQDVAVLTMKVTADITCDGKKAPSPVTSASVYVREGSEWKGAYHNEVAIVDPKTFKPPAAAPAAKDDKKADTETAKAADPLTDALLALEKSGWEAWKARDGKKLDEITGKDLTFVDLFGKVTTSKADVIKGWTSEDCTIKSVDVTNAKAVSLTPDVALLTYRGHADGTCGGSPVYDLWGTTVAMKEGNAWKVVYIFENP